MKRVKLRNGSLEVIVQRRLRALGYRFHGHDRSIPGSPDIVFKRAKVAVFIDGDFWHGWRLPAWEHKLTAFWKEKLQENRRRDLRNFRRLRGEGWLVVRIWEHQLNRDEDACIQRIVDTVRKASARGCS